MTDNTFILSKLNSKQKAHYEKSMLGEILGGILDKNINPENITSSRDVSLSDLRKDINDVRKLLQSDVSQQTLIDAVFGAQPHAVLTRYRFESTYTDARDLNRGHPHLIDGVELNEQQSANLFNNGILNIFQMAVLQCFGNQNITSLLRTNALTSPHFFGSINSIVNNVHIDSQKKTVTLRGALSLDSIYDHINLQEQFHYCLYEDETQSPLWIRFNLDEWLNATTNQRTNDSNYSCQLLDAQQQWQPAILPNTFEFAQLVALSYEIVIHENRIEIKQFSRQAHSLIGAPDPVREALTLDFIGPREDELTFKSGMKPPVLTPIQTNHDRRHTNLRLLLIIAAITLFSVINPASLLGAKILAFSVASIAYWYLMVPGQYYKHPFDDIQAFQTSMAKTTEQTIHNQQYITSPMSTPPVRSNTLSTPLVLHGTDTKSIEKIPSFNLNEPLIGEPNTDVRQPISNGT